MPHTPGDRSGWDKVYDMVKPFIEGFVHEHAGKAVFRTPLLGQLLTGLRSAMGPKPFAAAMRAAVGYGHVPRQWFPAGKLWDMVAHAVNEIAIDELGKSIAMIAELPDAEFDSRLGEIIGERVETKQPHVGAELVMESIRDAGQIVRVLVHDPLCPLYERTIEVPGGGQQRGGQQQRGPRRVPNPDLQRGGRAQVLAMLGHVAYMEKCPCVDAVAGQVEVTVKAAKAEAPAFDVLLRQLRDDERAALFADIAHMSGRLQRAFWQYARARLTSVEAIRVFAALTPVEKGIAILGGLPTAAFVGQVAMEGAVRLGRAVISSADDLRAVATNSAAALDDTANQLAASNAAAWDRIRRLLGR